MKRSNLNRFLVCLIALAVMVGVSSCNRGSGCPDNFSIEGE